MAVSRHGYLLLELLKLVHRLLVVLREHLVLFALRDVKLDSVQLGFQGVNIVAKARILVLSQVVLAFPAMLLRRLNRLVRLFLPIADPGMRVNPSKVQMIVLRAD